MQEEDAILEPTFPMKDNWLPHWDGSYVVWNKSNTMLVSHIQYAAGLSGKKRGYSTTLIT